LFELVISCESGGTRRKSLRGRRKRKKSNEEEKERDAIKTKRIPNRNGMEEK